MKDSHNQKLYEWLITESNLSCVSPGLGTHLVNLLSEVRDVIPKVTDPEVKELLEAYRDSLDFITNFAAVHQRAVIDKLAYLVGKS